MFDGEKHSQGARHMDDSDPSEPLRLYADPKTSGPIMATHMERINEIFAEGEGLDEFVGRAPVYVEEQIALIAEATADCDAFDVIEMLRIYTQQTVQDGVATGAADGIVGALDLIACLLLERGSRAPVRHSEAARPASHTPQIHDLAVKVLTASGWLREHEAESAPEEPLSALAAHLVQHQLAVKSYNYRHIADELDEALFAPWEVPLCDTIGFTHAEFITVRDAVDVVYLAKRNALAAIIADSLNGGESPIDHEVKDDLLSALDTLLEHPGSHASFDAVEIAAEATMPIQKVMAVLDTFAVAFGSDLADHALADYLGGRSVFAGAQLLRDGEHYLQVSARIGTDCVRAKFEGALKTCGAKTWDRYQKHRAVRCESLAIEQLESVLQVDATHTNLKYFRANADEATSELGSYCRDPRQFAEVAEADALFVIEDVAICVEVKSRPLSAGTRTGDVRRLARDLKDIVGGAVKQASRLERLVSENGGLWLEDRTWLDLSNVKEVRMIAVALDDIAPLSIAADELVRAQVITEARFAWVTSLHDLRVVADILDRPSEFLLYLRRRTERDVALKYTSLDELDMFMAFLAGDLQVMPNPILLHELYPHIAAPKEAELKRYRLASSRAFVGTYTDPLDAYMLQYEWEGVAPAAKPTFVATERILKVVDFLTDGHKPGWFRFSSDLLDLTKHQQHKFGRSYRNLLDRARMDHGWHTLGYAFPNAWGYPSLFVGTLPSHAKLDDYVDQLGLYMVAKLGQLGSDRGLGLIVDSSGEIISIRYVNDPSSYGIDLAAAAKALGLSEPGKSTAKIPPYARRSSRRLRGVRRRRG